MSDLLFVLSCLPNIRCMAPATPDQIQEAEEKLNLRFADDYRMFLQTCNGICAKGVDIFSLKNVIGRTAFEQEKNDSFPENTYVLRSVGYEGFCIIQDSTGKIFLHKPHLETKPISSSLADYLRQFCVY